MRKISWGWLAYALALLIVLIGSIYFHQRNSSLDKVTRLAFGSCNSTSYAQPIWPALMRADPQIWIWAGDNIYADSENVSRHRALYSKQRQHPLYAQFIKGRFVTGTWDDHDYGANNSGKAYPSKRESQQALLDFLEVANDDPRREREGVYHSHTFGAGSSKLKIILLDTRYHRDEPGVKADMLGEAQWEWLEAELKEADTDLTLLVSSTTFIPQPYKGAESWQKFPASAARLRELLSKSTAPVIILSGDLHYGEILRMELPELDWPLYEVMSSGMTHAAPGFYNIGNIYRLDRPYTALNFGFIEIDWQADSIHVSLQIRDADNEPRIRKIVKFDRTPKPASGS